jgi:uncharacterized protein YkwD
MAVLAKTIRRLVNEERHRNGLPGLKASKKLNISARAKAADMVKYNYFSHGTPHGSWYAFLYKYAGKSWNTIGENIARGQDTASQVMKAWMDSPEHRANILNVHYKVLGIGFARGGEHGDTEYWVQHFGG